MCAASKSQKQIDSHYVQGGGNILVSFIAKLGLGGVRVGED